MPILGPSYSDMCEMGSPQCTAKESKALYESGGGDQM